MYKFDTLTNSLVHFINAQPIKLELCDKVIELPEFLEISRNSTYRIVPLSNNMKYFDIQLQGFLSLSEDGILSGKCAEESDAEIVGNNEFKKITISKGKFVEISCKGTMEIDLLNDVSHRKEKYQIRKYR
jgi:hypothetical protein